MCPVNDPHIDTLTYAITSVGPHVECYDATMPELLMVNNIGQFRLAEDVLTVELAVHCSDTMEARDLVEPCLRNWEMHSDLTGGFGTVRFRFNGSTFHDRNPPEGSVSFGSSDHLTFSDSFEFRVKLSQYPEPPDTSPRVSGDLLRDLHARWCQHQEGKEPLSGMANYVLTRIELEAARELNAKPNRKQAALHFNISSGVLDRIGEISALPSIGLEPRKAGDDADNRYIPSQADEEEVHNIRSQLHEWLQDTMRKLILHLSGFDPILQGQLSMAHLKKLPPPVR